MAFKQVTVVKDGVERLARTPVDLVQFKHEGFVVKAEPAPTPKKKTEDKSSS